MRFYTKSSLTLVTACIVAALVWEITETTTKNERLLTAYPTLTTRTSNVQKYCPANVNRESLARSGDYTTAKSYISTVASSLGVSSSDMMDKVTQGKLSAVTELLMANVVKIAFFVGIFVFGLVLTQFLWPFLCCCCCCPSCCPSKCCRKDQNEQYTKCQLLWPTLILILVLLLALCSSVYGFINLGDSSVAYTNLACSISIFTDDLLNGNTTLNGKSFFLGMNALDIQITNIQTNLSALDTNLAKLKTGSPNGTLDSIIAASSTAMDDISKIPNPSRAGLTLQYDTPLISSSPTTTVSSPFVNVLGTSTVSGTIVHTSYQAVKAISDSMTQIQNNADTFSAQMSNINSAVATIKSAVASIASSISNLDTSTVKSVGTLLNYPATYGSMAMQVIYGVIILFSLLALLGTVLTACCNVYSCRHLMYFSCVFILLIVIIGFFISIMFSVVVMLFTWTCPFVGDTLNSQTLFNSNLKSILDNATLSQIGCCMPFGDGNLIAMVAPNANVGLNNLSAVMANMNKVNVTQVGTYLTGNMTDVVNTIFKYSTGRESAGNSAIITDLQKVSDPASYSCATAGFTSDSFIPSTSQTTPYVNCKVSGPSVVASGCSPANFVVSTNCHGCIDIAEVLNSYTTKAGLLADLNARYPGAGCSTFTNELANVWTNYFLVKKNALGVKVGTTDPTSGVYFRALTAQTSINALKNAMDPGIPRLFGNITTSLSSVSTITDPTYGVLAGLNCRLIGEDFQRVQQVLCGSLYNIFYIGRITIGIASFSLMFALCCIVCTGVRHYKHSLREGHVKDEFFPQSLENGSNRILNTRH